MKKILTFAIALSALAILGSSCEREIIEPQTEQVDLTARIIDVNNTPQNLCATPTQINLVDEGASILGTMEVSNTSTDELILNNRMSHGWLLSDVMFFIGDRNDLPKGNSGIVLEEMPYQFHLDNPRMNAIFRVAIGNQAPCFDITLWFRAKQLDFFGNTVAITEGWADGTSILDGHYMNFCPTPCNVQNSSNQSAN